jgi:hypothetical protein
MKLRTAEFFLIVVLLLAAQASASSATIKLNPNMGPAGQGVTVTGSGFGGTVSSIAIYFNGQPTGTTCNLAYGTIYEGCIFTIPSGMGLGTYPVVATDVDTGISSSPQNFQITTGPPIGTGGATIQLSPDTGSAGQPVTVTGSGFGGTVSSVTIYFAGQSTGITCNVAYGNIYEGCVFNVPPSVSASTPYLVVALDTDTGASGQQTFTVGTGPPVVTATSVSVGCGSLPSSILALPLNLIGFSLIALLVSFDVIAVGYIISKIIPGTAISGWINEEFLEMAKTAMLIVGIFSILVFMSNVAAVLTLPGGGSGSYTTNIAGLTGGACNYLETVENGGLQQSFSYLMSLSTALGAMYSTFVGAYLPLPISLPPFPDWIEFGYQYQPYHDPIYESDVTTSTYESLLFDFFALLAFPTALLIYAQYMLLPTFVLMGLAIMIPFGLILRAFPLVRGVGGTFIAVGIGAAIIYPSILVLFNGPVTNALAYGAYSTAASSSCGGSTWICYLYGFFANSSPFISSGLNDGFNSFGSIFPALNGMLYYGFVLTFQLILFIIDLLIALPFVDTIARSLGGTLQLSLGGRLKLA